MTAHPPPARFLARPTGQAAASGLNPTPDAADEPQVMELSAGLEDHGRQDEDLAAAPRGAATAVQRDTRELLEGSLPPLAAPQHRASSSSRPRQTVVLGSGERENGLVSSRQTVREMLRSRGKETACDVRQLVSCSHRCEP